MQDCPELISLAVTQTSAACVLSRRLLKLSMRHCLLILIRTFRDAPAVFVTALSAPSLPVKVYPQHNFGIRNNLGSFLTSITRAQKILGGNLVDCISFLIARACLPVEIDACFNKNVSLH